MQRVVIFTDHEWAFGSLHSELIKNLHQYGIDASLLPWAVSYGTYEIKELDSVTDVFMTNPHGFMTLMDYGIDPAKMVVVAHGKIDLYQFVQTHSADRFDELKSYGAVSGFLVEESKKLGISREPSVVNIGVNTNRFFSPPATKLNIVGYASKYYRQDLHTDYDLKRGYLAHEATLSLGLEFRIAETYHNSHVTMPGFYGAIDAVLIPSTEEGAGIPALEAAASGRLVVGTPVGHWSDRIAPGGGITVSVDHFLDEATATLQFYKDNPDAFTEKCAMIQQWAIEHYDWSKCINGWVQLFH
jgi:hypothetical protein